MLTRFCLGSSLRATSVRPDNLVVARINVLRVENVERAIGAPDAVRRMCANAREIEHFVLHPAATNHEWPPARSAARRGDEHFGIESGRLRARSRERRESASS